MGRIETVGPSSCHGGPGGFKGNHSEANYSVAYILCVTKRPRPPTSRVPHESVATVVGQWRQARPDLDLGPLGLFAALAQVHGLTAPHIERLMAGHGLARGMFDVLTTLRRVGPPYALAPKDLTRSLLLSGAGMTSRLDRLEALKLITRLPEPRDRRSLKIQLTPSGLRLVDKILPDLIDIERRLAVGLTAKQVAQLTTLLAHLARGI